MQFEQTFMNFLLEHQERHRRTGHFLVLMDAIISAAKHIEHYYITGALKGYLGRAGWVNIQGEDVMHMDDIAHEIIIHYLKTTGRVIQAVSEESDEVIKLNEDGRYFMYFDPLDGSSNVAHGLPVGFLFGLAKRNLTGDEDFHLRAGREYIAAGMFVIPTGTLTFALRNAGAWRFHIDETFDYVRPTRIFLPDNPKTWELSFNATNRYTYRREVQDWVRDNERKYTFRYMGALAGLSSDPDKWRNVHVPCHCEPSRPEEVEAGRETASHLRGICRRVYMPGGGRACRERKWHPDSRCRTRTPSPENRSLRGIEAACR